MSKVIVAMPAYNEESYIGTMVLKCRKYADEVVVIDDGSTDETANLARQAGAVVYSNVRNMGVGAALKRLFFEVEKSEFDVLVILDADTQHDPDDIPQLVKPIIDGYDMVIGSRKYQEIPFYRALGNKVLTTFTNTMSRNKVMDTQSGFRAFSGMAVKTLHLVEDGMAWASEMVVEANKLKLKVIEVPISVKYTKDSHTLSPLNHSSQVINRILLMISRHRPLLFFGVGGVVVMVIGLVIGVVGYQMYMVSKILPAGMALIAVFLLMIGILSVFVGIILNAINGVKHG